MKYRATGFDDNRTIVSLTERRPPEASTRKKESHGGSNRAVVSSGCAYCRRVCGGDVGIGRRGSLGDDDVWLLPVAVGVTSDTVVGSDVHRMGRSPHPADGQGSKSLARDYARILDALSRAMAQRTRRRRRPPQP